MLDNLSLTILMQRCREETSKYHQGLPHITSYCLELFRRALRHASMDADAGWRALIETFTSQVEIWFYTHRAFRSALAQADAAFYVQDTFSRLFLRNQKTPLVFHELGQALYYLQRCLNAAIYDQLRRTLPPSPDPAFPDTDPPSDPLGRMEAEELWQKVLLCTKNARERRVVHLLWVEEYTPRQIVADLPEEFPDVKEIYQIRVNVLARLVRRFPEVKPKGPPDSRQQE